MAHHSGWRSCFSRRKLTEGGSRKHRDDFNHVPSPSEWITRAEVICLLTTPPLLRYRLLAIRVVMPLHPSNTHAMMNPLEPLCLKTTARCASRGPPDHFWCMCSLADLHLREVGASQADSIHDLSC
jgi:hypothetical protein